MAEWDLGESQFKNQMDANLRFLSAAVQLVLERSDGTLPTPPAAGMLAIDGNGAIVGYIDGAWKVSAVPKLGWAGWDKQRGGPVQFGAQGWASVPWVPDAPKDGRRYIRKDGQWVEDDYRISAFIPQITAAGQQLGSFIIPAPMALPKELTDCVARCQTPSPSDMVISLQHNATDIGTVTFLTGELTGTIALTGTEDIQFAKHDELNLFAPSPNNGVPEGIRILFRLEM